MNYPFVSERVPQSHHDATVAAIGSPLVSRLFEAMQEQAGQEREPSILELAQMPLLKLKGDQRYSNLSPAELLAAIEAKRLNATKTGGEWKIRREALEECIRRNF